MEQAPISEDIRPGSPAERKGLALAAIIISLAGLFCAFITGWRIFSFICSMTAIIIAVFCIARARKPGTKARLALWALAIGILGLLAIAYFLLTRPAVTEEAKAPAIEMAPADRGDVLDKLQHVTDSAHR